MKAAALTDEQRELAARYYEAMLAVVAERYAERAPGLRAEIVSAVGLGVVHAARGWDPARGGFFNHAKRWSMAEVRELFRARRRLKRGPDVTHMPILSREDDEMASPDETRAVDDADAFERLARHAGPHAAAVRAYYRDGLTMEEIGRPDGLGRAAVCYRLTQGRAAVRRALADTDRHRSPA